MTLLISFIAISGEFNEVNEIHWHITIANELITGLSSYLNILLT